MSEWQVLDPDGNPIPDLFDVEAQITENPFANYAVAQFDDREGDKFDKYPVGTVLTFRNREGLEPGTLTVPSAETVTLTSSDRRIHNIVNNEGTINNEGTFDTGTGFSDELTGFVVERRELEQQGADVLELEVYSFDQLLRGEKVGFDTSGMALEDALQQIIEDHTPVEWVSANVTVGDPQQLTRNLRGEKVENALLELRFKSENEDLGVNSDLEFYFEPQEAEQAPRDIDNTQWFSHDIPEKGKDAPNEARVYFNDGDESVTISKSDQLDLQDDLGTVDPVKDAIEVNRPEITDIDDARDVGQQILEQRAETLTGTVTTYGLLDAEPGQVISVTIAPRGIDTDFRIAGLYYIYATDQTRVTIVEETGEQDELLVRVVDNLDRVEMENADRDGTENQITDTNVGVEIDVGGDVGNTSFSDTRFTNAGRNALRDAWRGQGTVVVDAIAVGDDASGLSRTNDALANETERDDSPGEILDGDKGVTYSGSVAEQAISEVGLFDTDGNLLARGIVDSPVTATSVSISLTVSNDTDFSRGVVTDNGQQSVRDSLADNGPALPDEYAYGSGDSMPSESDTDLDTRVDKRSLDTVLIQEADAQDDWPAVIGDIGDNDPFYIDNREFRLAQSNWLQEAQVGTGSISGEVNIVSRTDFSNGDGIELTTVGAETQLPTSNVDPFRIDYTIPESEFTIYLRLDSPNASFRVNAWLVDDDSNTEIGPIEVFDGQAASGPLWFIEPGFTRDSWSDGDIPPGNYRVRIEAVENTGSDNVEIDLIGFRDKRFSYNFDNTVHQDDGYLDGPELFPDGAQQYRFETATTRRTVTEATLTQTWDDTSGNQFVEVSNDDGANWTRASNSNTVSATFASAETDVDTRVGMDRYPPSGTNPQSETPRFGYNGQSISVHELTANPEAITPEDIGRANVRNIIGRGEITGETLAEAGLFSGETLLTRSQIPSFTVGGSMRVISSEDVYWNRQ